MWGLWQEGWALAATDDGQEVFPVWPAKEYAALCAEKEWANYEPEPFSLTEFMDELLPRLKDAGILPGIFYTPSGKGVTPVVDQVLKDLERELENYQTKLDKTFVATFQLLLSRRLSLAENP